jgi:hypothetical protein
MRSKLIFSVIRIVVIVVAVAYYNSRQSAPCAD